MRNGVRNAHSGCLARQDDLENHMAQKNVSRRAFVAGGAAATAGALALGLAGCGGGDKKQEGAGSAAAVEGGTLTAATAYSSTNYTPVDMCGGSALMIGATWHVFEGLYDLDMATYQPYAALAAGDPEAKDGVYTIALRDGAKFSDGTDVTAADVVNAIKTNMAAPTIGPMLDWIKDVKADGEKVVVTAKYACDDLVKPRLALCKVFPKAATADELAKKPIGSGPWAYDAINGDEGGEIDFVKNEHYNGPKAATADTMQWHVLKDDTSRTTSIVEGTVGVVENVPDANADQITAAGAAVDYVDGFNQAFFMFNCEKKPFNDKRVRQAFFYAIDVEKLISNQLVGHAEAIKGYLPKDSENYSEASTVYTYDPEKAKALLKEAGAEGLKFELMCNNNWVSNLSAQIKEDLDAVGLECTLNVTTIDWATMNPSDKVLPYDVMLTPGDPTCFGKDADMLLKWWYGDNVWTNGRSCWAKGDKKTWQSVQDKMAEAVKMEAGDAKKAAYKEICDIIAEEVPLYGLFHRQVATAHREDMITGFSPIGTTGLFMLGASATSK